MNREEFFGRVRDAVHAGRAFGVATQPVAPAAGYVGGGADLPARLGEEIAAVGGVAHVAESINDARRMLERLLAEIRPASCLCWEHPFLDEIGLWALLACLKIEPLSYDRLAELSAEQRRGRSLAAGLGITACDFAVAETGSVALCSAPGRERTASLLPPVYVTLVDESVILPDLFDLFDQPGIAGPDALPSNLVLITGPSKTGDVELTLTTGVHGPGVWHVIIVRRSKASGPSVPD